MAHLQKKLEELNAQLMAETTKVTTLETQLATAQDRTEATSREMNAQLLAEKAKATALDEQLATEQHKVHDLEETVLAATAKVTALEEQFESTLVKTRDLNAEKSDLQRQLEELRRKQVLDKLEIDDLAERLLDMEELRQGPTSAPPKSSSAQWPARGNKWKQGSII